MSLRTRMIFRRLFVATLLVLPVAAGSAFAQEGLRPLRELNAVKPRQPKLSRLLEKLQKNRSLVDAEVKGKRLTIREGNAFRQDLAAIEKKARAMARKRRDLIDERERSLDSEIAEIGRRIRS